MAIIGNTYLGLIDMMKRADNDLGDIVEALHTLNPVMRDANVMECNMGTKHRASIRTGLPSVSWGALYEGIKQSKSTTTEVDDVTGFVEGLSTVDSRLLKLAKGNAAKVRMSESTAFLEAMSQEFEKTFWYSNIGASPRKFHGFFARYNALTNPNVVNGGGVGSDNTSIAMITWGDQATSIITPEGMGAGIDREDKGEHRVTDGNGDPYYAKDELFTQHGGCHVKDWRYSGRVANIDVSNVIAGSRTINPLLRSLFYKLQGPSHLWHAEPGRHHRCDQHGHLYEPYPARSARRRKHERRGSRQFRPPEDQGDPGRGNHDLARHSDPRHRQHPQHRNGGCVTKPWRRGLCSAVPAL